MGIGRHSLSLEMMERIRFSEQFATVLHLDKESSFDNIFWYINKNCNGGVT